MSNTLLNSTSKVNEFYLLDIYQNVNCTENDSMDTKKIRLNNLFRLIDRYGGQSKLSEVTGIDSSYLSQIKNPNNPKNIGEKLARRIESACNLEAYWMDVDHNQTTNTEEGFCDNLGMETLATRIKQARKEKGMSQDELAEKANVSQSLITKLESGRARESRKIAGLATALDVSVEWLATGKGPKKANEAAQGKIESNAGQDNSGTEHLLPHEDIPHDVRQIIQDLISLSSTDKLSPHAINMIKAVTETSKKQGDHDDKQK